MSRPMSEVLRIILARLELTSSIYGALDACQVYGDITRIERETADAIIMRWMGKQSKVVLMNSTSKKIAFKKLIQQQIDAERIVI